MVKSHYLLGAAALVLVGGTAAAVAQSRQGSGSTTT